MTVIVAVGLVAAQMALRQYVGAAVLAGGLAFVTIPTLLVTRKRRETSKPARGGCRLLPTRSG